MRKVLCKVLGTLVLGLAVMPCAAVQPLTGSDQDYDALLAMIGQARIVMLGESTHGSREFYEERARLTRRLIEDAGFSAVVLEAPWEPVRRVDAYIRGAGSDADAATALSGFIRFPRWVWRNPQVRDFVEQLRTLNQVRTPGQPPLRLYGMDLYSVPESAAAVVRHLAKTSASAAAQAQQRYACFDQYLDEPMVYGREVEAGRAVSCAEGAAEQLVEMTAAAAGDAQDEERFAAWQSARVVQGGEAYYRAMFRTGEVSWNRREMHMADTLSQLLERLGPAGKIVVWAHNSHQGDARETDQGVLGEFTLGHLMRELYDEQVVLVGLSTYRGWVRAARRWGAPDRVWRLRPALAQSWPGRLHQLQVPRQLLIFRGHPALAAAYAERRLERVVGVMYVPADELGNHYRHARLSRQFDAVIHLDLTHALPGALPADASRIR